MALPCLVRLSILIFIVAIGKANILRIKKTMDKESVNKIRFNFFPDLVMTISNEGIIWGLCSSIYFIAGCSGCSTDFAAVSKHLH